MSQDLPENASIKFFLIDSHEILLAGAISVLRSQYPDAKIITAQTADNAFEVTSQ
jgi:hypothetical protein